MANGSVVRYTGKRGTIFRLKYRDASGKQVQETLGSERAGWTERKANQELRHRLSDVEREQYVKPEKVTFGELATRYLDEYLPGRNLKRATAESYRQTITNQLIPILGDVELSELDRRPELIDRYITAKTREGLSPKTIRNHIAVLGVVLKRGRVWRLMKTNPLEYIEKPRIDEPELNLLTQDEIADLWQTYDQLIADASEEERPWWQLAKTITFVALGTALRRGELFALRWRDVDFDANLLRVREAVVLGEFTTPKSRTSRRTIELGPHTKALLEEHRRASFYDTADDLVFCHPEKGTKADPSKLSRVYLRPALRQAAITKPFRPFHDLRHTALTHEAAAGNPQAYIQLKAGHSQGSITERYIHAAQVLFPGAAARGEAQIFGARQRSERKPGR